MQERNRLALKSRKKHLRNFQETCTYLLMATAVLHELKISFCSGNFSILN